VSNPDVKTIKITATSTNNFRRRSDPQSPVNLSSLYRSQIYTTRNFHCYFKLHNAHAILQNTSPISARSSHFAPLASITLTTRTNTVTLSSPFTGERNIRSLPSPYQTSNSLVLRVGIRAAATGLISRCHWCDSHPFASRIKVALELAGDRLFLWPAKEEGVFVLVCWCAGCDSGRRRNIGQKLARCFG